MFGAKQTSSVWVSYILRVGPLHPNGGALCDVTHPLGGGRKRGGHQFPLEAERGPEEPTYELGGCHHPCTPHPDSSWGSPLLTLRCSPPCRPRPVCVCSSAAARRPQLWPQHRLLLWCGTASWHCDAVKKVASFL